MNIARICQDTVQYQCRDPQHNNQEKSPQMSCTQSRKLTSQTCLTTGGLAENGGAAGAKDNALCVAENGGDVEAAGACW